MKPLLRSLVRSSRAREHRQVKVDLVTEHPETGVFAVILLETGPWEPGTEERELRRVQARLYDCIDAAVGRSGESPTGRAR